MWRLALAAILAVLAAGQTLDSLTLAQGQKATLTSSTTAKITCQNGYKSIGVAEAIYVWIDGAWNSAQNSYLDVHCVSTCGENFDAGFGVCSTYSDINGFNYNYCFEDFVSVSSTCNGSPCTVQQFAYQQCSACGKCGNFATVTSTPVPLPSQPARTVSRTLTAYGGCAQYTDSILTCSERGVVETTSTTPSSRSCGFATHLTSPVVYWDFCGKADEAACADLVFNWRDSMGRSCRDYGVQACGSRSNKRSTDTPNFFEGDTFASYVNATNKLDASEACCICGGGTKKCLAAYISPSYFKPYVYQWDTCDGIQAGDTCTVSCVVGGSPATVPCTRTGTRQSFLDTSSFPSDCESTHLGWGVEFDEGSNLLAENMTCDGIAASTMAGQNWIDCVQAAVTSCASRMTWDYNSRSCTFFNAANCTGYRVAQGMYTFSFQTPAFPPVLSSCAMGVLDPDADPVETAVVLAFTQGISCIDPEQTSVNWFLNATWVSQDGTASGSSLLQLEYGNVPATFPIPAIVENFAEAGVEYSFTLQLQTEDGNGVVAVGPASSSCALTVSF